MKIIKIIKQIWIHKRDIWDAFINKLFSTEQTHNLAQSRLEICHGCPASSENNHSRPYGHLPYDHCTECGCMLNLKTYSPESKCPLGKW